MIVRRTRAAAYFLLATLLVAVWAVSALAQANQAETAGDAAPSVQEIVEKANAVAYYQGKDGRAKVAMTITDSQGRTRQRQFTILRMDDPPPSGEDEAYCGDQRFYVYFHLPADVNKMAFMVWKHVDKDDDRWLYLPALDLVKRIAAAEKRTSFVGSNFFYEDVSGRNINADEHELVDTSENYYVLKNTPKDPATVEFAYYKMWVHRKTFTTVKVEYYDENDEKYREYEALGVETVQEYPTVTKSRMKDLRTGGNTVIEYSNVKYDVGLTEDIFTERYLQRPPLKYLR
jgi:outer membrane lipoprotein-sorting protein